MEDNNDTAEHDAKPPPLSPSGDIDKKKGEAAASAQQQLGAFDGAGIAVLCLTTDFVGQFIFSTFSFSSNTSSSNSANSETFWSPMTSSSSSSLRKDSLYLAVLFAKHQWQWRGIVTSSSSAAGKLEEQNKLRLLLLLQRRATLASASSVSLTRISASMNT